jgi:predicted PurR-regulated permease PerM
MLEEVTMLISTLGFPIAVCCYLLWERHSMIQKFTKAINDLKVEIVKLNERCNGGKKT